MSIIKLIPALLSFALALAGGAARAETSITFPPGWTITELPAPEVAGRTLEGGRRRAMLAGDNGRPAAVIELTTLPAHVERAQLEQMVAIAEDTETVDYKKINLDNACTAPVKLTVAGEAALRADCTVQRSGTVLIQQVLVMWVSDSALSSLTYTAAPALYKLHMPEFDAAMASAHSK